MIFPYDKLQKLSLSIHWGPLINLEYPSETEYKQCAHRRKIIIHEKIDTE